MTPSDDALQELLAGARARRLCAAPLPHPSPRNTGWLSLNPWFEQEVVPELRERIHTLAGGFSEIA